MGANEKLQAAMHGGEHDFGSADPVSANRVRFMSESELDRFIAKIKAEAWDEGAMASESLSCENPPCGVCEGCNKTLINPYREQ